jgi:hypothetical protein
LYHLKTTGKDVLTMKNDLNAPAQLHATAQPSVNRIEFSAPAVHDGLYEIWRRHGDTVDWYLHASIPDSMFEDSAIMPGQYYEYKVRAVRGDEHSEFSESVVVYGK